MKQLCLSIIFIILSGFMVFAEQLHTQVQITINGLVCDFCARALEKTFSKQQEVKNIDVNLDTGLITVHFKKGQTLDDDSLKKAVINAGYNIEKITRISDEK